MSETPRRWAVTLPMPPSVNDYYRSVGGRVLISKAGRAYRQAVAAVMRGLRPVALDGRVRLWATLRPPDGRRRDLDNVWKALADSLSGWLYGDDGQIDDLRILRGAVTPGGAVEVEVSSLEDVA